MFGLSVVLHLDGNTKWHSTIIKSSATEVNFLEPQYQTHRSSK
jgi:hypothetical protein